MFEELKVINPMSFPSSLHAKFLIPKIYLVQRLILHESYFCSQYRDESISAQKI